MKESPVKEWSKLNARIVKGKLKWDDIKDKLLEIISAMDNLWENGKIPEGEYRQKGNHFKDTVIALVKAQCGINVTGKKVKGRTDKHAVDLCYFKGKSNGGVLIIAGEAKMLGSPKHLMDRRTYPERTITIDIDKRSKEVKYTPIDLKRLNDPEVVTGWKKWIDETKPKFFSAWMMRFASKNHLGNVISKLEGISEYNNGVGIAIYKDQDRRYAWVDIKSSKLLTLGDLVDQICAAMRGK